MVTAVDKGNTVICAETSNGLMAMCNIEVNIAVGSVSGCITYSNKATGNPSYADSGADVQLIPVDIDSFPSDYSLLKSFEEYGIYHTNIDTLGNYKFTNIPAGKYRLIYMSEHADWHLSKVSEILDKPEVYIKSLYGEDIGSLVLETSFMKHIYWTMDYTTHSEITITKGNEVNKSFNVVNWSAVM